VARLFHQFDKQAQQEVAQASPIAARYLAIGRIKQGNSAFLRDTPADTLAANPKLMQALGINVADFGRNKRRRRGAACRENRLCFS
jgi:hypothetical protein